MMQRRVRAQPFALIILILLVLTSGLPPLSPHPAFAQAHPHVRRYPYLTDVVGQHATINWGTDDLANDWTGRVSWGAAGGSCTTTTVAATKSSIIVNGVPEFQWKAALTGLRANSRYCYRVYLDIPGQAEIDLLASDPAPQFQAQLAAGDTTPFSFVVFGDWGETNADGTNPDQTSILQHMAHSGARFALTTGDNGYPDGSQTNYGDLVQSGPYSVSVIFGPDFWSQAQAGLPIFPTIGNHGFDRNDANHPHLLNWPQSEAVTSSGGRYQRDTYCCVNGTQSANYPSTWYAFDAGTARFYMLEAAWSDSNVGTGDDYGSDAASHWATSSAEYQWLAQDLAAHGSTRLKFAFFHYPLYSDDRTEPSDTSLQGPDSLEGLLSRYGVALAFSGHAHMYERNVKAPDHSWISLVSYVTGGGGADPVPVSGGALCSAFDAYAIGWSSSNSGRACGAAPPPTSKSQVFHFLLVHVNGTTVTVTPTNALGQTFDAQTYDFSNGGDVTGPRPPTDVTATQNEDGHIRVQWSAATDDTGVRGYTIRRNGITLTTVQATGGATQAYTDTQVAPAATYRYAIEAFDIAGNHSALSNTATAASGPPAAQIFLPLTLR